MSDTYWRDRAACAGDPDGSLPCGTESGYQQHLARGEDTCPLCRLVHADYVARMNETRPQRSRESGTRLCVFDGCTNPQKTRLYCGMHYHRLQRHGSPSLTSGAANVVTKFFDKVSGGAYDECWQWGGALQPNGYGKYRSWLAHRFAYQTLVADIPDGLEIDHLCRNRGCVNPWHMEPVTTRVNVGRADGSGWPSVDYSGCVDCKRPMRPQWIKAKDWPGTVTHGGGGRCGTCYARYRKAEAK